MTESKRGKTLRISGDKLLIYSPQHHGYIDPEQIRGTTIYRFKKTRHKINRCRKREQLRISRTKRRRAK